MATIFTDNFVRFATQRPGPGDNIEVQHIPEPIVNNALDCQSPYRVIGRLRRAPLDGHSLFPRNLSISIRSSSRTLSISATHSSIEKGSVSPFQATSGIEGAGTTRPLRV